MSEILSEVKLQVLLEQSRAELVRMVLEMGETPTGEAIEKMRGLRANGRRINDIEDGIDPDLGTF